MKNYKIKSKITFLFIPLFFSFIGLILFQNCGNPISFGTKLPEISSSENSSVTPLTSEVDETESHQEEQTLIAPTNSSIKINSSILNEENKIIQSNSNATITLSSENAKEMLITSKEGCIDENGEWIEYNTVVNRDLDVKESKVEVFVKFRSEDGLESECLSDHAFVDATSPIISPIHVPSGYTQETTATITVEITDPDEGLNVASGVDLIECRLDSFDFEPCDDTITFNQLADGNHSVQYRATDRVGNQTEVILVANWIVDTTAPKIILTTERYDNKTLARFEFDVEEDNLESVFCRWSDQASDFDCSSRIAFRSDLPQGEILFSIHAKDKVGLTDHYEAQWIVDTIGGNKPTITGIGGPGDSIETDLYLAGEGKPKVFWTASSEEKTYKVSILNENKTSTVCQTATTSNLNHQFTCQLNHGTRYTAEVQGFDHFNNPTPNESAVFFADLRSPIVEIEDPKFNFDHTAATINYSVFDDHLKNSYCQIKTPSDDTFKPLSCSNNELSINGLIDGSYSIKVIAEDKSGNPPTTKTLTFQNETIKCAPDKGIISGCPKCNELDIIGSCTAFSDDFERSELVLSEDFHWQKLILDDGVDSKSGFAEIKDRNFLGPMFNKLGENGSRAVLFTGRNGGSTHETYLISRKFDVSTINLEQFDRVVIYFNVLNISIGDAVEKKYQTIFLNKAEPSRSVMESLRVDVCKQSDSDCGLSGNMDQLRYWQNWEKVYSTADESDESVKHGWDRDIKRNGVIDNYQASDWVKRKVDIDLNTFKNNFNRSKQDFVFRFTAAMDEGFPFNSKTQKFDQTVKIRDGILLDNVEVYFIKDYTE